MVINKYLKKIKKHFIRVLEIKKSPHSIALGFAIGTLISVIPTPGLNILVGLLIIMIFPSVNKISLLGAIIIWNSLFLAPIYILSYRIGDFLFGSAPVIKYNITLLNQAYNFSRRFLVGNMIMAVLTSVLSYIIVFVSAKIYARVKYTNLRLED